MKIKILIIEDEAIVALDMASKLQSNGYEIVGIVDNGIDAIQICKAGLPDIVLVDISIKGDMDGVQTVSQLQSIDEIPVIYVTAFADKTTLNHAARTYPYAYLVKPFRELDLFNAIELAFRNAARSRVNLSKGLEKSISDEFYRLEDRIFVRTGNASFEKVLIEDILYLQADRSYCNIVTSESKYVLSNSLNHILQSICVHNIIRIHKSYAVNMWHVTAYIDHCLFIKDIQLPIGIGYRQSVIQSMNLIK